MEAHERECIRSFQFHNPSSVDDPTCTMEFQDRVIAISGANSGIGRGLASYLALRGARLSLADINGIEFAEGDPEFGNLQKISKTAKMDVRSAESVNRWIEDTVKHFGRLDGAVNCAGVWLHYALNMAHTAFGPNLTMDRSSANGPRFRTYLTRNGLVFWTLILVVLSAACEPSCGT